MNMPRCPLCMNELPVGTKMLRFCGIHPGREHSLCFELTLEDRNAIFCPGRGSCNSSGEVKRSPVLVHLDCVMLNPFISAAGELLSKLEYVNPDNQRVTVDSWEYEVTKQLYGLFPGVRAMFFPQAMFRALNETMGEQKVGASTLLLGEQGVGKSVLATMVIRRGVWNMSQPKTGGKLRGSSFSYISPPEQANTAQPHALGADSLRAADDRESPKVVSTGARLRNIRALFLRRLYKDEAETVEPEIGEPAWIWNWVKDKLSPRNAANGFPLQSSVLVLYDVAGEQAKKDYDKNINDLIENADRIAVLIDAEELSAFGGKRAEDNNSLRVASKWLTELDHKPRCLVVTKLDKVIGQPMNRNALAYQSWEEWRAEFSGDSARNYQPAETLERDLLKELLAGSGDNFENQIYGEIVNGKGCPVYFVWTEGVDATDNPNPVPMGLHRFVQEWCMHDVSIVAH